TRWSPICATTLPTPSVPLPSRRRSSSPRTFRRRDRARSCAACFVTSPKTRSSVTPRRSRIPRSWKASRRGTSRRQRPRTSDDSREHVAVTETRRRSPEHWTWRDVEVAPGPAAIVDLDGVLSDAASRQHYLEAPRRNWDAFFEACGDDPVIEEVKVLLDLLDSSLSIVLLTARPERFPHLGEVGLHRIQSRGVPLGRRRGGTYASARAFKQASMSALRRYGFALLLAIEDDRRNVEMFRAEGVPCIYFHSGYY